MLFHTSATATFVGLAGIINSGVKALTITSPSGSSYWVQFQTNTIAWGTSPGDPPTVTISIIQPNNKNFIGSFAIAEYVPADKRSYDVTNVTLSVADGYQIQMVDSANTTHVYATSAPFSVRPIGTAPAEITYAPGTVNATTSNKNGTATSGKGGDSTNSNNGSVFKNTNGSANSNAKSAAMGHFQSISLSTSLTLVGLSSFLSYVAC